MLAPTGCIFKNFTKDHFLKLLICYKKETKFKKTTKSKNKVLIYLRGRGTKYPSNWVTPQMPGQWGQECSALFHVDPIRETITAVTQGAGGRELRVWLCGALT